MPAPVTIKQAKAAYKYRSASTNTLTEREKKQLERSAALDRRAWSLREKEKARVEAVKKRAEREKLERVERRKTGEEEQRRRDRHGFLASQLCLGAFFGRGSGGVGGMVGMRRKKEELEVGGEQDGAGWDTGGTAGVEQRHGMEFDVGGDTEEEFEDVDDDSLLEALRSPEMQQKNPIPKVSSRDFEAMPPPPPPQPRLAQAQQRQPKQNDRRCPRLLPPTMPPPADLVWPDLDFLDSSTQIARELDSLPPSKPEAQFQHNLAPTKAQLEPPKQPREETKKTCSTSFGSCGSFDLTEADLEELDLTPPAAIAQESTKAKPDTQEERTKPPYAHPIPDKADQERARASMPPPALPLKNSAGNRAAGLPVKKQSSHRTSMPPPTLPSVFKKPWMPVGKTRGRVVPPLEIPRSAKHKPALPKSLPKLPHLGSDRSGDQHSTKSKSRTGVEDKENIFTLVELESFVEEDLQLTQAC